MPVWDAPSRLVSRAPASLTPAALARIVWAVTEARGVVTGHAGALRCTAAVAAYVASDAVPVAALNELDAAMLASAYAQVGGWGSQQIGRCCGARAA